MTPRTCRNGHEVTPETAYISPDGFARCRKCRNAANVRWQKREYGE